MVQTEYIILDRSDHPGWDEVPALFTAMYAGMDEMGLMVPLDVKGEEKWMRTARNTAGKFGIVILALQGNKAAGFAHGMIKFLPDYLGGLPVGMITHVFVRDDSRRTGIAGRLVHGLEAWFRAKNVSSIELQVISANPAAKKFWKKMDYSEELVQYRKTW